VHELRAPAGTDAHTGFAVGLLAALAGAAPILWVSASPLWYPPGLAWAGLDPARCLFAQARDDAESLSSLETALRGGMAGVAACTKLSRLAAKRLAMAARQGGGIGLVLRHAPARTREDSTAFATRWLISPAPGGPELPRLRAELLYAKGGRPGVFFFELGEVKDGAAPPAVTPIRCAG
jgi:protein ImuA